MPAMRLFCKSMKTLNNLLESIISDSGEGIILRMPKSIYQHGRSSLVWKVKAAKADGEALVVRADKIQPVILQLPNGIHFEVSEPLEKGLMSKRGEVVTFTYDCISKSGLPVNPVIYRSRSDLSWEDVLRDYTGDAKSPEVNNGSKGKEWNVKKMRWFFENFAHSKNKDPLLPSTWQSLASEFMQLTEARQILVPWSRRNYVKTVMKLFPEILVKESKFTILPYNYWEPVSRRRKLFVQLAKHKGFDPLIAKNWYEFPRDSVLNSQHAKSILTAHYNLDLAKALLHLFPEIGLDPSRLTMVPGSHWYNKLYQRKLLSNFAKDKGFDPLIPKNWYLLDVSTLPTNICNLISFYRNNFKRALTKIFPSIGLDKSKFSFQKRNYWHHIGNRRAYLESYAELKGFDPLIADNWCKISAEELLNHKYSASILGFYDKNYVKALQHLFPEVHFDETKFLRMPRGYWSDPAKHRELFVNFARQQKFDPLVPDNWYHTNTESIFNFKGVRSVLPYYGSSIKKALLGIFPDIGLNKNKFGKLDKYWADPLNQKRFFEKYAVQHGFDPLVPTNWYSVNLDDITNQKGARSFMVYYGGSCVKALAHVFPNIDKAKFTRKLPNRYWQDTNNQRNWFISFAEAHSFDPLKAQNWYSVSYATVMDFKGARSMLAYYGDNYIKALMVLFPNIGLDKSKFLRKTTDDQREFFITFAKANNFDPLSPSDWYNIDPVAVRRAKGAGPLLRYFNGSLVQALSTLFPDIGLDPPKFSSSAIT